LAIVKEIVVSHGGQITADSDGKHIKLTVELPAKQGALEDRVIFTIS
jgi:signal transduction histidine kinase